MKKKGQLGDVIRHVIIAFIIVSVTFFGYSTFAKFKNKACKTEIAKFEIDLRDIDKTVKYGSVREIIEQVPCNADEIYFFDLNKDIKLDFLDHLPLLKDSVQSKAEKNVFIVKDDKIIDSFYAGNLDMDFPNYRCFIPKFDKINFFLEGRGTKATVFPGCFQPECTYIPIKPEDDEAAEILDEAEEYGKTDKCINCPEDKDEEFFDFVETRDNVQIFRKYEYCIEEGKTNVEIVIKPKGGVTLKEFRFYESIPKGCVDDLKIYLLNWSKEHEVSIKDDPLIIWTLDEIKEEERLTYTLDKTLTENCKEIIEGLGIANTIEEEVKVDIPGPEKIEVIEMKDIPAISLNGLSDKEQIAIPNLWTYTEYSGRKQNIKYRITKQTNEGKIDCSIENKKEIKCKVKENIKSFSFITVQAEDGNIVGEATFEVNVNPSSVSSSYTRLRCKEENDEWETSCEQNPSCGAGSVINTLSCTNP
ncbi:MAG: hypothetical protein QF436_01995 [Candidatus Woesearchaeota archaeon]|jgi:hypothetical protein|nr:hypothetical protein [Candidatus Woesearchaeota archaeon]MDP7622863.1 hypothetical protein [Candidatus Woesearchaeota archaeon]HJN56877.1 hypothetical protein [Candidatus Woesearchaeota archaeon]|tara:strand:- start:23844 stop:25265 length:1422 start_codon:yes stop_codon:yes gene_type:complete